MMLTIPVCGLLAVGGGEEGGGEEGGRGEEGGAGHHGEGGEEGGGEGEGGREERGGGEKGDKNSFLGTFPPMSMIHDTHSHFPKMTLQNL